MSFPKYPKYRDSGVEWLGDVPELWEIHRLSPLSTKITNGYVGPTRDIFFDDGVRYLQSLHIKGNAIRFDVPYFVSEDWSNQHKKSILEAGDVLIVQTGDIGQATVVPPDFAGCNCHALIIVAPRRSVVVGVWISWVLNSDYGRHSLLSIQTGALHPHLNCGDVKDVRIPLPPLSEQTAIASFLDAETSKIDALIAEQRRLIELLKEKRQAVISHAVTKGLNPDAPMKPSGIEWLGDVPEHWEIRKVSHLFRASKGKHGQMLTKEFLGENEGEYPVYSGQTENDGVMGTWTEYEFDFGEDGVLFSTTVGAKAMHLFHLSGRFSLSQNCMIIAATDSQCDVRFSYYHFQPLFAYERAMIPEHMQASFRMDDLYRYRIAIPPNDEQREISEYLDDATATLDALTSEATRAIDLLQERRTALISAAVTGKIDVREFANVEAA